MTLYFRVVGIGFPGVLAACFRLLPERGRFEDSARADPRARQLVFQPERPLEIHFGVEDFPAQEIQITQGRGQLNRHRLLCVRLLHDLKGPVQIVLAELPLRFNPRIGTG